MLGEVPTQKIKINNNLWGYKFLIGITAKITVNINTKPNRMFFKKKTVFKLNTFNYFYKRLVGEVRLQENKTKKNTSTKSLKHSSKIKGVSGKLFKKKINVFRINIYIW